ncbi:SOS response-associated peptidase [Propionicicella superfundia]|uniref:SOS response-associated peptidase n=1 Tax=Propionicicella superfundia TaxID=348582 RepID=UPI000413D295|nr:SOS response-associated peptidase [Propionicicella superfundia]
MCGRYAAVASEGTLVDLFGLDAVLDAPPPPNYNIAPTDPVPAVWTRPARDGAGQGRQRQLTALRWGLVPSWATASTGGARLINARLESVADKPSFRRALDVRRCLLPALGYYEWYTVTDRATGRTRKQPVFLRPGSGGLFVMAGLYEFWRDPAAGAGDQWLRTCAIITTRAADSIGHVHDRMPVTVPPDRWGDWLAPDVAGRIAVGMVNAEPGADIVAYEVAPLVNRVGTNGPELVEPLTGRE